MSIFATFAAVGMNTVAFLPFSAPPSDFDAPFCIVASAATEDKVAGLFEIKGPGQIVSKLEQLGFVQYEVEHRIAFVDPDAFGRRTLEFKTNALKALKMAVGGRDAEPFLSSKALGPEAERHLLDQAKVEAQESLMQTLNNVQSLKLIPAAVVTVTVEYDGKRHRVELPSNQVVYEPEKLDSLGNDDFAEGMKLKKAFVEANQHKFDLGEKFFYNPRLADKTSELERSLWHQALVNHLVEEVRVLEEERLSAEQAYFEAVKASPWGKDLGLFDRSAESFSDLPPGVSNKLGQMLRGGFFDEMFGREARNDPDFWQKCRLIDVSADPAMASVFVRPDSIKRQGGTMSALAEIVYIPLGKSP